MYLLDITTHNTIVYTDVRTRPGHTQLHSLCTITFYFYLADDNTAFDQGLKFS